METAEEVVAPAPFNINDLCYTVARGKRTKRKRPHSPISFSHRLSPSLSAASMAADTTAAEEDTARSLILLSRGHFHQGLQLCDYPTQNNRRPQTAAERGGSAITGVGVYACKTCDRVFSSFQALGGHRTSHNKPKNDRRTTPFPDSIDDTRSPSSLSLQLSTTVNAGGGGGRRLSSPKTHECSYCGAEFPSGQALGGHMRRHRAGPTSPAASGFAEGKPPEPKKSRNGLLLDLNFPAPEDENERFEYGGARRKESPEKLVISATTPTLVDCHY